MEPRHHSSDKEKDTVHDPKRKRRLQHRARLVDIDIQSTDMRRAEDPKCHIQPTATGDVGAIRLCYKPQVIYTCYEGAYEGEVDEAYEASVVRRPMVAEKGKDGPGQTEGRHDEED